MKTEQFGTATICLADCMELLPAMAAGEFDLAVTDPPYFAGPNKSGYYGKGYSNLGVQRSKHYDSLWCWELPSPEYFAQLRRVSAHQIVWGANHFADAADFSGPGWIVWDKLNGDSSFADAELAYSSFDKACRVFRYVWNGMHQGQYGGNKSLNEKRIHPTQKPVALYQWLLETYAAQGHRILDTHLGSGSSAIAAIGLGFQFVGIEMDPSMFDAACHRIEQATKQLSLINPCHIAPKPIQLNLEQA